MKNLLTVLFVLISYLVAGQINCSVTPGDINKCPGDSLRYLVFRSGTAPFFYQWQKNSIDIAGANDSTYLVKDISSADTGQYRCRVTNATDTCFTEQSRLGINPGMHYDTLYRYNELGCPGTCKGQMKALVSGGVPPYDYQWGGGYSQDTIVFGLCEGEYTLKVYDANYCHIDSAYEIEVLKTPDIITEVLPDTVIYLQKPTIFIQFPDTSQARLTNWSWNFGDNSPEVDNLNPASHSYSSSGEKMITLYFTDLNGCSDSVTHLVNVKEAKLKVYNVITPNGDEWNAGFAIELEDDDPERDFNEAYLSNELVVFDRNGKKIYAKTNYKSEEWTPKNIANGTYYYILRCNGEFKTDVFKGVITVIGSK
ncbi:MAG: hypothetical protein FJY10_03660 [Bacteroidetes bacterium]|nr:hypothetical protein [Bacteroidota bacterium]